MAAYVNGRKVEYGSPEWARGDVLAGLTGSAYAGAHGFSGAQTGRYAFSPYSPPPIPSGYYDPSLDAQRDAASRGLLNTEQDVGLAGRRSQEDYGFDTGQIETGYNRGVQDLTTSRDRGVQDLTTGRDRGFQDIDRASGYENEDYGRNVGLLTRQYTQQGRQQGEQARKYGVTSGGIALLSAAKRNENQAIDRQGLDTTHTRAQTGFSTDRSRIGEDYTTGTGRLNEDFTIGTGRLGEDRTTNLGRAGQLYDRGVADRGTALSRARSEDMFYGLDVGQQKVYQAQQAGYDAPTGPANEFTSPAGKPYRVVMRNGYRYEYDPSGKVLNKRKA